MNKWRALVEGGDRNVTRAQVEGGVRQDLGCVSTPSTDEGGADLVLRNGDHQAWAPGCVDLRRLDCKGPGRRRTRPGRRSVDSSQPEDSRGRRHYHTNHMCLGCPGQMSN